MCAGARRLCGWWRERVTDPVRRRRAARSQGLFSLEGIDEEVAAAQRMLEIESIKRPQQRENEAHSPPNAGASPRRSSSRRSSPHAGSAAPAVPRPTAQNASPATPSDAEVARVLAAPDHYVALSIGRGASEPDIKKAYYKMSRTIHPDKCRHSRATEAFQRLQVVSYSSILW